MSMQLVIFDETHLNTRAGFRAWQIAAISAIHTGRSGIAIPASEARVVICEGQQDLTKLVEMIEREVVIRAHAQDPAPRFYLKNQAPIKSKNKRARRDARGW